MLRLQKIGVRLNANFFKVELEFLGRVITPAGMHVFQ